MYKINVTWFIFIVKNGKNHRRATINRKIIKKITTPYNLIRRNAFVKMFTFLPKMFKGYKMFLQHSKMKYFIIRKNAVSIVYNCLSDT